VRSAGGTVVKLLTPELVSETREGAPDRLRRRLAGDLDAIVLKALRKDPRQRYSSVEQFAADIRNYLDGKPVLARPASVLYQAAKFVRRHRYAILATAAVFAALVVGIAGTSWQAREAARQRDHALAMQREARTEADNARVEAAKSKRVIVFLKQMLTAADPGRSGPEATVGAVLEQVARHVERDFGDDPEVESAVRTAIAETYLGLGRYTEAEAQIRDALRMQREIHGGDHFDVAQSLRDLAAVLHAKGDAAGAEQVCRETLAMQERLHGPEHPDFAQALNDLGAILRARGALEQAEQALVRALALRQSRLGPEHLAVAETLTNLAGVHLARRDAAAALAAANEALRIRRLQLKPDHPDLAQAIDNVAVMLASAGRYADAEPLHREALALYRARLGPQHPDLATTLSSLAGLLFVQDRFTEALEPAREAVEIRRAALPAADPRTAYAEHILGMCLLKSGAREAAEATLLAAVQRVEGRVPADHPRVQGIYRTLVELYSECGRPEEAAKYQERLTTEHSAASPHDCVLLG
jgi:tetratricopeptide (TPR) repeat protein